MRGVDEPQQLPEGRPPQKGDRVGFWYRKPGESAYELRSGVVDAVKPWGLVIFDDLRGDYRAFRFDRMGG